MPRSRPRHDSAGIARADWSTEAFADVLPFFKRLEADLDFGDQPYHGRGGPLPVSRAPLDTWPVRARG